MSLLLPEAGLLFWMLLSFGIVFALLAKYGFPVIIKMVEDRKLYINQSIQVAKDAHEQLSKLKSESELIIATANKEQGRILKETMLERDKIIYEARKQAEAVAQKELDNVKAQILLEKEEAIRDIRRQVAVLSVDIAEKVIRKTMKTEKEQMEMIDRMLDEVLSPKS
ncbi:F0F1 ATP synthase subunit B [Bacteroides ihuae]|uniref:F0F1 ATP synthase subunit B n=1 Tax=Bacteroides ihuae TaxID=1852362 RepID=UPI0008DB039B|nr:F0F1 ATP synthase subunit B [Bacteroides ihuae]